MENRFQIFITRICICIFAVSMTMLAPLIVKIGADFKLGVGGSGFLFTAYYISNIFFCLITGKIISLIGKRVAMASGVFVYGLATFLFSQAERFWMACVLISIMGALATFIEAVGMDIVDELSKDEAASNLAVTHGFAGIGSVVGVAYAGLMLHIGFHWRTIYLVLSIAVLLAAALFCITKFPPMVSQNAGGINSILSIFKNKKLYPTFLALFLYVGTEGSITGWMATYMTDKLGYTALFASLGTALIWVFVTVGRMICSRLVIRYTVQRIILTLDCICILSILLSSWLPNPFMVWIAVIGIGIGLSGMWPLIASTALSPGNNGGTIMSIILFFGYFGSSVIPYMVGRIGEATGMESAILSCAIFFIVLGLTVWRLLPHYEEDAREGE